MEMLSLMLMLFHYATELITGLFWSRPQEGDYLVVQQHEFFFLFPEPGGITTLNQ